MKNLFLTLLVLAVLVISVGFYRGWFTVSSPDAELGSHKVDVNLSMDPDKMKDDAKAVKTKITDLTDNVAGDKTSNAKPTDEVKAAQP